MNPQVVAPTDCIVGENPLWSPVGERVYWCDIPQGKLYRYNPETGRHVIVYESEPIGGFTVQTDGSLLLFGKDCQIQHWDRGKTTTIVDEIAEERGTRFNDVQADPNGGVFCGTMPTDDREGRLYHVSTDQSIELIETGLAIPNGMGFTPDREHMYLTETNARTIWRYSYDTSTGVLGERESFVQTEGDGVPDGLAVDESGAVWSAQWDGNAVVRYDDTGEILRTIRFPTKKVSSLTFGNDDAIYASTAGGDDPEANGSLAGALFRLQGPVAGADPLFSEVAV